MLNSLELLKCHEQFLDGDFENISPFIGVQKGSHYPTTTYSPTWPKGRVGNNGPILDLFCSIDERGSIARVK